MNRSMQIATALGLLQRADETAPAPTPLTIPSREVSEAGLLSTINVYRAVALLSLGAGQLTMDVWRGNEQLDRPFLVRMPAPRVRFRRWAKLTVASLALTGNAYWRVIQGPDRETIALPILDPHECEPLPGGRLAWARRDTPLESDEFRHLQLLTRPGSTRGLGPIQAARGELAGAAEVSRYGSNWFTSGDVPSGILKTDQVLTDAQAAAVKQRWRERHAHEVAVFGQGLDYKPFLLSPEDAQFIATRQFDTTAIARLFGIPARLFLAAIEGSAMTYANVAADDLSFVRWTLSDYLGEIEDALSSVLPGRQEARFNLDGLLRPDTKTRYESHKLGIDAGWLLRSEVRDIEGLPPAVGVDDQAPADEAPADNTIPF